MFWTVWQFPFDNPTLTTPASSQYHFTCMLVASSSNAPCTINHSHNNSNRSLASFVVHLFLPVYQHRGFCKNKLHASKQGQTVTQITRKHHEEVACCCSASASLSVALKAFRCTFLGPLQATLLLLMHPFPFVQTCRACNYLDTCGPS